MFKSKFGVTGCLANPSMDIPAGSCIQDKSYEEGGCEGDTSTGKRIPGYRNTTGWPPCCVARPGAACIGKPGPKPKPSTGVQPVYDEAGVCINCGSDIPKSAQVSKSSQNAVNKSDAVGASLSTGEPILTSQGSVATTVGATLSAPPPTTPPPSDNSMLFIGLGITAAVVLVYFLFFYKKKKMFFGSKRR